MNFAKRFIVKVSMPPAPGGKPGQTGTRSRESAA